MCSYFDTTDGYLRFISTIGQATVLFLFRVVIFSGGSKNIAGQMTVPFFFRVVIFSGGLKNIAGQTTVPFYIFGSYFFRVVIDVCTLTQAAIMVLTYDRKKILPE